MVVSNKVRKRGNVFMIFHGTYFRFVFAGSVILLTV